jgi:cell division protein FtsL
MIFYNGAFSIASKNDLDDQNVLLATVHQNLHQIKESFLSKLEKIFYETCVTCVILLVTQNETFSN